MQDTFLHTASAAAAAAATAVAAAAADAFAFLMLDAFSMMFDKGKKENDC